jgi:NADPH-dependent 2,4-dienoyl-CoA reductase/sulfur reductase-like enzyme
MKVGSGIPSEGAQRRREESSIDLLIVGGGPCGLATAISARRAGMSTLVLEGE